MKLSFPNSISFCLPTIIGAVVLSTSSWQCVYAASAKVQGHLLLPRLLQEVPMNDLCEDPILLQMPPNGTLLEVPGTTVGATQDTIPCLGDYRTAVYFQFVSASTGAAYEISTCHPATDFNTSIYVDSSSPCDAGCTSTRSDYDGECSAVDDGLAATVKFFSEPNTTYTIVLSGIDAESSGNFGLTLQEYVVPQNDKCEGVEMLEPTVDDLEAPVVIASTANATPAVLTCQAVELIGVYYQFQGTGGIIRASTCTAVTDFNATLFIDYSVCSDIGCSQLYDAEAFECEEGFGETIEFRTEENVNYTITVRGATYEDTGTFGLILHEYVRPRNDVCTAPTVLEITDDNVDGIMIAGSTENATIATFSCRAELFPTVFYSIVGNGETFYATTCFDDSLDFNSSIIINEGKCEENPSACSVSYSDADFGCGDPNGNAATVEWETQDGVEYLIAVKGVSTMDKGAFQLIVQSGNLTTPQGNSDDSAAQAFWESGTLWLNVFMTIALFVLSARSM